MTHSGDGFAVRRYRILEIFHLHVEVGQVYEGTFIVRLQVER